MGVESGMRVDYVKPSLVRSARRAVQFGDHLHGPTRNPTTQSGKGAKERSKPCHMQSIIPIEESDHEEEVEPEEVVVDLLCEVVG